MWKHVNDVQTLEEVLEDSVKSNTPKIFYKHSTRCIVSLSAKKVVDRSDLINTSEIFYIDVIQHRDVSNYLEEKLDVKHESPQLIVSLKNNVLYHASHAAIDPDKVQELLTELESN